MLILEYKFYYRNIVYTVGSEKRNSMLNGKWKEWNAFPKDITSFVNLAAGWDVHEIETFRVKSSRISPLFRSQHHMTRITIGVCAHRILGKISICTIPNNSSS